MPNTSFEWTYEPEDENLPALTLYCEVEFSDSGDEIESFIVYHNGVEVTGDLPDDVLDAIEDYARDELRGEFKYDAPINSWYL